jgi:hypothetical protein
MYILLFFSIIAFWSTVEGASSGREVGFLLLREGIGARAEAMGGAYTAVTGDQTSTFWNPAGVAALKGKDFLLSHHRSFQGINQSYAGWAFGNERRGVGLSLGLYSVGGIEARTGPSSKPLGTFGIYDVNAGLTYGQRIGQSFFAGFSVRALHEAIGPERASGLGLDFGGMYRTGIEGLMVGATYRNMGRMEALDAVRTPLPGTFRAGAAYVRGKVTGSLDLRFPRKGASGVHTGLEYRLREEAFLRAGFRSGIDTRKWSFGLGLNRRNWRVDYAFVLGALGLGGSHRVAVGIR